MEPTGVEVAYPGLSFPLLALEALGSNACNVVSATAATLGGESIAALWQRSLVERCVVL